MHAPQLTSPKLHLRHHSLMHDSLMHDSLMHDSLMHDPLMHDSEPGRSPFDPPFTIGLENAGCIEVVGEVVGADRRITAGDIDGRVVVVPQ